MSATYRRTPAGIPGERHQRIGAPTTPSAATSGKNAIQAMWYGNHTFVASTTPR